MTAIRSAKTDKYGARFKAHVSERGVLVINMNPKHQKQHGHKVEAKACEMFDHKGKVMFL